MKLFGQKESLGVSSAPQVMRKECEAGCKHDGNLKSCVKPKKESSKVQFRASLKEANQSGAELAGRRFRVTLIREGLGNFGDCFYYTASAIQSAVSVFEGKKFFLNHPSETEEFDRPERDVKEISGYFENIRAEQSQDGAFKLTGDLVMPMSQAFERERALMLESLTYSQNHPDQDLIGLSINADGNSTSIGLEQFMLETQIPDSCKEKLLEALKRGITTIRPVQEITSAISCDLVTEAGAGGRIDQLLEQEKTEMKVKAKESKKEGEEEAKKEAAPAAQDGQAPAPKEDAQDGDGDSDGDAEGQDGSEPGQDDDADLIKKMLDKYLGEPTHDEESMKLGQEAYQNAKAMGMDEDEAMKCAGYNMKMAKHIQSKAAGNPDGVQPAPKPAQGAQEQPQESEEKGVKESAKNSNKIVALTAENARLKTELEGLKLEKFIDKTLKESKLPMSATKRFRECIKDAKTEKEVTDKFGVFKEAFSLGGEADGMGFIIGAEKQTETASGGLSFSDCVEN